MGWRAWSCVHGCHYPEDSCSTLRSAQRHAVLLTTVGAWEAQCPGMSPPGIHEQPRFSHLIRSWSPDRVGLRICSRGALWGQFHLELHLRKLSSEGWGQFHLTWYTVPSMCLAGYIAHQSIRAKRAGAPPTWFTPRRHTVNTERDTGRLPTDLRLVGNYRHLQRWFALFLPPIPQRPWREFQAYSQHLGQTPVCALA